jgi:hypothetical protein
MNPLVNAVDVGSLSAISTLLLKNEIDDGMSICWGLDTRDLGVNWTQLRGSEFVI